MERAAQSSRSITRTHSPTSFVGGGCHQLNHKRSKRQLNRRNIWINSPSTSTNTAPYRSAAHIGGGTIAMQRLQFSSNLGIAFCVSAGRVPQAIIYE